MPFPANDSPWPLAPDRADRVRERSVWYAGDPDDLEAFYRGDKPVASGPVSRFMRKAADGMRSAPVPERTTSKFWGSAQTGSIDEKVHVPAPEKIATMSAEALFADAPRFVVEGPTTTDPNTKQVTPAPSTQATQDRLDALVDQTGLLATLMSAAETASALGSVALRLGWDPDLAPHPTIARADADAYEPAYSWGVQTETLFWRNVSDDGTTVLRHLELHEKGFISHALYRGTRVNLGRPVPLTDHPATASLPVNEFGYTYARPGLTTAVSIPNMLPDAMDRTSNVGRSDFTPSVIGLFSAIDQTMTSLMRDIEDGESKLIVADYMLRNLGFGKGAEFPANERLFVKVKSQPGDTGAEMAIQQVQFTIRVEEHLAIIRDLMKRTVEAAGYTPDQDQGGESPVMTATEYVGRNKRTLSTRDKKILYWRPALERLLTSLLVIDREVFGSPIEPMPVKVIFPDAVQESPKVLAETAAAQVAADASSRYTRVKTMHPDWDEGDVLAELARIEEEQPEPIDPETLGLPAAPGTADASEDEEDAA